jgi:molybdopterin/thiamine biosynthesis adenylyltransferase/rhodanese-related sulfurtransferase
MRGEIGGVFIGKMTERKERETVTERERVYMGEELTDIEKERYSRHLLLEGIGIEGQKKLKQARVLVIGSGGLGCPVLLYLAAAGVGNIGIADPDTVDLSNLQRQVLFGVEDISRNKAEAAKEKLLALNPLINIKVFPFKITSENAMEIIQDYDIIADGSDNFATRYLMNDACVLGGKINVYASVSRFEGQLSVFNYLDADGIRSPDYRDLYPSPPAPGEVLNCAEAGVMGALTGIMGSLQANEVIKVICDAGDILAGKLFIFNSLSMSSHILKFSAHPENPLKGDHPKMTKLIDYEIFCGNKADSSSASIRELSVSELHSWIESKKDFQLIDVREQSEYETANIGGDLIPFGSIQENTDLIHKEKAVVIHCQSGGRSRRAIAILQGLGYDNVYNLDGGIVGYLKEFGEEGK